jgi:PAS domain S-box-containing protein
VGQLVLGGIVAFLAGATWWLTKHRSRRPVAHWIRAWFFLFFATAVFVLADDTAWREYVLHLFSPFFPALFLAGALAYAHRRVPVWLLPAAFTLGVLRCSLIVAGYRALGQGIALATEPVALIAAAGLAFGEARHSRPRSAQRLLAPSFVGLAAVETAVGLSGLSGSNLEMPILLAWSLVTPFAVLVQLAVGRELTLGQQRGVERALSDSHERFRALTENAFDLIAEMDGAGRFTYTNPRYEEWIAGGAAGLRGKASLDLVHSDDRGRVRAWFAEREKDGGGSLITLRISHKDLGWRWVECSARTFGSADERRTVATSRDVTERIELELQLQRAHDQLEQRVEERTSQLHAAVADLEDEVSERKRVEQELRRSEQRWRDASELSSDLSFAVTRDAEGFHTDWVTQAVTRISGRSREEIDAIGWASIIHADDVDLIVRNLLEIGDDETREFDGRIVTPVGKIRWMRTRIHGSGTTPGGGLRILGAARDVTDARNAVEKRIELEAHIREAQKLESLGVLAGGVAHDFNNVLAVILGNDALALSDAPPESKLAKQLKRIRDAAKHGQALTNQMLTYSGRASVSLKPLDLYQVAVDMSELLEAAVSGKCHLDVSKLNGPTAVEGDPTQLRQVIMNLVTNASESLQDQGGRVNLRCGVMTATDDYLKDTYGSADLSAGPYVFLEVSDPGRGIDEAVRQRIFEPFFSTKFTGRGLGLASVLGIVRGHRGAIKLMTEPGSGTRFRVLIPPVTEAAIQPPLPFATQNAHPAGACVLVVDDDAAVLEVASEFLRRAGHAVRTAGGGREALEILRGEGGGKIAAVVLDLSMPDLDGRETLVEIRRLIPELPVVVASGFDERAGGERFAASEFAAYIRKPYEPEELVEAVREALKE